MNKAKITNDRALKAHATFEGLSQLQMAHEEKGKALYSISRNTDFTAPVVKAYQAAAKGVLESHAEKDKKGNLVPAKNSEGKDIPNTMNFVPGGREAAEKELQDLLDQEIEVDFYEVNPDWLEKMYEKTPVDGKRVPRDLTASEYGAIAYTFKEVV